MEKKLGNDDLLVNKIDSILSITLNRPNSLNAFSPQMILGIKEALTYAKNSADIRVVTIAGAGRAFSAGGDVKSMGNRASVEIYEHIGKLNELILMMKDLEKPIIAVTHGFAAGAGFNLALACDQIIAANDTKFILSFSKVGLISDGGGLYFLPRIVGVHKAKELLFNAEPIEASEAKKLGIVNQVYPSEQLEMEALNYAQRLAKGPSRAYAFIKKISDQALVSTLDEILEQERITQAMIATTEDHVEGVNAFKEKRNPNFTGK